MFQDSGTIPLDLSATLISGLSVYTLGGKSQSRRRHETHPTKNFEITAA
jgi:hypothetical protein